MAVERRRRMPAAQRREVILAAAEETFARCGYHGASLDDIAHGAGVSKALIYEHFASKRELHASLPPSAARSARGASAAGWRRSLASSRSTAARGGCCSATRPTPRWPSGSAPSSGRRRRSSRD